MNDVAMGQHTNITAALLLSLPLIAHNLTHAAPTKRQLEDQSNSIYSTRFENVTWDNQAWQLTTTNLNPGHYQARMSLANGYIGINVASLGPFFEYDQPVDGDVLNGWPLFDRRQTFATVGGFWDMQPELQGDNFPWLYQYGWVTAISGIPHWAGIGLVHDNSSSLYASTDPTEITNFTSSLDMKHSIMDWSYTWSPSSSASFDVTYQMFLHKVAVNEAYITVNVTARENAQVQVVNILDGDCALRTMFQDKGEDDESIYSAVSPNALPDIKAYIYATMTIDGAVLVGDADYQFNSSTIGKNESSIAMAQMVDLQAGQTMQVVKYVGIASSDAFPDPQETARNAAQQARENGYYSAMLSHMEEWETLFPETSVDNYSFPDNGSLPDNADILEAQIMAVANPFYLLQNTVSESAQEMVGDSPINNHSIAVGGLGSDSYAGLIFWDSEVWMQPGLVAAFPYAAKGILNYRLANSEQAQKNIETAYQSSKNDTYFSPDGAIFPWTSGRYGNCTATGPCWDYEYHLNGDIGLSMINYWLATGDTDSWQESVFPVFDSISLTQSEILQANGSQWSLTNMTDPDEFANHVDNGGFTMPLIAEILEYANTFRVYFGDTPNDTWSTQAENVFISRNEDANIILEYTGMNGTVNVKQADVVLVTYPLSYTGQNYTTANSLSDLDYYANKQSQDGPGMTYAIFSVVANEASLAGCSSYTYQQYSTQPYVRAPWFQFSEQLNDNFQDNGGFHPAFPFLTGHGGANQVVLFGYLGLRYVQDWVLHIDPSVPPQIPYIRYRTFYWQGWPISAWSNQTHTTLSRTYDGPVASGVVPNSTFEDAGIPVALGSVNGNQAGYEIPVNGTLTVENRQIGSILAVPGNLGQCQPAFSEAETVPGQFAISAVDGASSTTWQPKYANESAQMTVQLETGYRVSGFRFEWADAPPYNYTVWMHNDSSFSSDFGIATAQIVVEGATVEVSEPFEPELVAEIRPIGQNVSALWLNGTQVATNGSLQVDGELWTSRFVTLEIWGNQYNASYGVDNMMGEGATVAEFNVIVEGLP